ncbi:MAG: hypothetical protein K1X39_08090 [Thermoflexales bacterium]|nr:hypothetical protein [Thermoflexales bacterium]
MPRLILLVLCLALVGCGSPATAVRPVVQVLAPQDGVRLSPGEPVQALLSGAASAGIDHFEVRADSALLVSATVPGFPIATTLSVLVPGHASGARTLAVTVVDRAGAKSDPVFLTLNVSGGAPSATQIASTPASGPCALNSAFVADVTIPDNTPVLAGTSFTKTWRLRNSAPCGWDLGVAFVFLDREQMGAPGSVLVGPVAAGGTFEVSVPFIAPANPGIYTSTWQLRDADGKLFGSRVYAQIRVP